MARPLLPLPLALALLAGVLPACDEDLREPHQKEDYRCAPSRGDAVVVRRDLVCDGRVDCPEADDELDCPGTDRTACDQSEYAKTFYEREQRCDGHADCQWADDEKDCPDSLICPSEEPMLVAIPRSQVCDGNWDCLIDEYDCPDLIDPFTCADGPTIDRKFVCDGVPDCRDDSDELDPSCEQILCHRSSFLHGACANCSDGTRESASCEVCKPRFLPKSKVCDGVVDCEVQIGLCDGGVCTSSDEMDCP